MGNSAFYSLLKASLIGEIRGDRFRQRVAGMSLRALQTPSEVLQLLAHLMKEVAEPYPNRLPLDDRSAGSDGRRDARRLRALSDPRGRHLQVDGRHQRRPDELRLRPLHPDRPQFRLGRAAPVVRADPPRQMRGDQPVHGLPLG